MALELSLVIRGDQAGAKKALEDTATGIETLGNKARAAAPATKDVAEGVGQIATEAPAARTGVDEIGSAVDSVKGKFTGWQAAALGAIGGIAGALGGQLLSAALQAATGAFSDYFGEITNSAANIEADLTAHKDLIAAVKGLWNEAEGAASSYGLVSQAGLRVEARSNVGRLDSDFQSTLGAIRGGQGDLFGFSSTSSAARAPFDDAIARFRQDLKDGRADVIAFREEVASIADALPSGSEGFSYAERLLGGTQQAAELQAELQRSVDLYKALTGDADAATTALGKTSGEMVANGEAASGALPALREYAELMATIGNGGDVPSGSPAPPADTGGGWFSWLGFADGGFTGYGGKYEPAGVAHRGEVIWSQDDVQRHGGPQVVEAMRIGLRGYATGGVVGGSAGVGAGSGGGTLADLMGSSAELAGLFSQLGSVAKSFGTDLMRSGDALGAFENVAWSLAGKFFGAAGSAFDTGNPGLGGIGGTVASLIGTLFGGGRAAGGPVRAGQFYEVGENGRELFAPGVDGAIIPNGALGGGRPQLNVNVIGAPSTPKVRQQPNGDVDVVFDEVGRRIANGSYDKAFNGRYGVGPRMGRPG
jgi:hypothetical protein